MNIEISDLIDLARGAAFLGTGGGGDPYIGRLLVQQELERGRRLVIVPPESVDDEALIVPVATMGAPSVQIERFPSLNPLLQALAVIEERMGRKVGAVMPIEVGGINSTLPLAIAARTGLPVVDADGMGRAFPELQMMTFNIYGCSASPVVMTNDLGDVLLVETQSNDRAENLARNGVVAMGGGAHIALYPMTGRQMKASAIPGTLTLALDIGRAIAQARAAPEDTFAALASHFAGAADVRHFRVLFHGKIVDISRDTLQGFSAGSLTLEGIGEDAGSSERFEVLFRNENLLARRGGTVEAIVPDLICILDGETAEPVTNEALKYGQRVRVIGMSVPEIMRTPEALAVFGPAAFGFSEAYTPFGA